ncbi:hypothetical protein ACFY2M_39150 [Streptomyces sp. NPDC001276]|uniref:hypothetical protein n=1 Tax=Streptomyces sp. NPDC001276 TaxID=3364555 RepID=UPI003675670D
MRTPIWCLGQASPVEKPGREMIDQLLEVDARYQRRAAQGVLRLRKKPSAASTDTGSSPSGATSSGDSELPHLHAFVNGLELGRAVVVAKIGARGQRVSAHGNLLLLRGASAGTRT